jgi:hypothetical protein
MCQVRLRHRHACHRLTKSRITDLILLRSLLLLLFVSASLSIPDASLAFELAEKVLRDKLGWLMQAGAGLKGTAAAALGHALVAAAAEGQPGQAAGGTAAEGASLRAPREELLEPFPAHVLVRLLLISKTVFVHLFVG